MKKKTEFLITKASPGVVVDTPDWFEKEVSSNIGNETNLTKWGNKFATVLHLEELYLKSNKNSFTEVESYNLLVDDEDTVICPVSTRYNLVQNSEVADEIVNVVEEFNVEIVGYVRDYKDKAVLDIYPVHNLVLFDNPDVEDSLAFGIEVRIGHDKTESVKARPIVRDSHQNTTLRGLTDWLRLKHVKPENVESKDISTRVYQMVAKSLFSLGYMADSYLENVEKSYRTEIDFSQEDFTIEEFYEIWLEDDYVPNKVKEVAPRKALVRADITNEMVENIPEGKTLNMWALISGYTYALGNSSSTSDGYNKDKQHETASKALRNPKDLINEVREEFEKREEKEEEVDIEEKAAQITSDIDQI